MMTVFRVLFFIGAVLSLRIVNALADELDPSAIFSESHDSVVLQFTKPRFGRSITSSRVLEENGIVVPGSAPVVAAQQDADHTAGVGPFVPRWE